MVLDEGDVEEMRVKSKQTIEAMWKEHGELSEEDLADPDRPLRVFYEDFKDRLRLVPLDGPADKT